MVLLILFIGLLLIISLVICFNFRKTRIEESHIAYTVVALLFIALVFTVIFRVWKDSEYFRNILGGCLVLAGLQFPLMVFAMGPKKWWEATQKYFWLYQLLGFFIVVIGFCLVGYKEGDAVNELLSLGNYRLMH